MYMNKKTSPLDEIGKNRAFNVPEGYFESISGEIMSRLPERIEESPRILSRWERMKPWVYMAAMFGGIALMVRLFVGSPEKSSTESMASEGIQLTSSAEIEEFYRYYEDQAASSAYRETFYLENQSGDVQ